MKKFLATIFALFSLFVLGGATIVNANEGEKSFKVAFLSNASDGSTVTSQSIINQIDNENSTVVTEIATYTPNSKVYAGINGLKFGSSKGTGSLDLTFDQEYLVTKVIVNAASYKTDSAQVNIDTYKSGNLTSTLTDYVYQVENPLEISSLNISISGKRGYVKSIEIFYSTVAASTYNIIFDANGGTFSAGKGESINDIELGKETEVVLPTESDLIETAELYTTLVGWNDGTTTHNPGSTITVSKATKFTAVYKVPETITVAQALEICEFVGTAGSEYKYTLVANVSEIVDDYSEQYKNMTVNLTDSSTIESIQAFRLKVDLANGQKPVVVGDEIKVTGQIVQYGSIKEISNATFELITSASVKEFIESNTKSSLKVVYDIDTQTATDVDLRFGSLMSASAYVEGAKYGVIVMPKGELSFTAGLQTVATAAEFVAANTSCHYLEATNIARVNANGIEDEAGEYYQFAWVITNMEGHYQDNLVAVSYMEYEGKLYFNVSKEASVASVAETYVTEGIIVDEVLVNVLKKLYE